MPQNNPIGALVTIQWAGGIETVDRYFSFGQWKEDENEDEYGVPDSAIFFYAFEGERDLHRMKSSPEHDFLVIKWTLIYEVEMALDYM